MDPSPHNNQRVEGFGCPRITKYMNKCLVLLFVIAVVAYLFSTTRITEYKLGVQNGGASVGRLATAEVLSMFGISHISN